MRHIRVGLILGGILATSVLLGAYFGLRSRSKPGLVERASAAYEAGDWNTALELARTDLKTQPRNPDALRLFARASLRLGREEAARSIYGSLGGERGMKAEDSYLLGRLLRDKGETEMAERCWMQGLHDDPDHAPMLLELTKLHIQFEKFVDAIDLATRLSARPGYRAQGEFLLGDVRSAQGDLEGAVTNWQQAFKDAASEPEASGAAATHPKRLARALLGLGRPKDARAVLEPAGKASSDPETAWLMSRAWLQEGDLTKASQALATGRSYREEHPLEPEPAPYVRTERCAECHRAIHQVQQHSVHARTFSRGAELAADRMTSAPVADPSDARRRFSLSQKDGKSLFEMRDGDKVLRTIVDYAFGSGDHGLTLVGRDEQGRFRECRLSRYMGGQMWDVTTGQPEQVPHGEDGLGRVMTEDDVVSCIYCHSTDPRMTWTGKGPVAAERGIACERCHGPGGHHLQAVAAGADKFDDLAIARPVRGQASQVLAVCRDCHTLRGGQKVSPEEHRSVRFPSTTLTWSRCFKESNGQLDCLTCHEPHRDSEQAAIDYDAKCLLCHRGADNPASATAIADKPRDAAPHKVQASPCPVNRTQGCRSCHMPDVPGIIPHSGITDHYIRIHPELPGKTGAANRAATDGNGAPVANSGN